MGGLDLFKATQDSTGKWKVENLGAPINSMADDFGITFAGKEERGFFCSNRNDARGYDHIYSFERPTITIFIEGIVNDVDEYPIEDATVRIVGKDGLNVKVPVKKDGTYRVELERDIRYVMMASAVVTSTRITSCIPAPRRKTRRISWISSSLRSASRLLSITFSTISIKRPFVRNPRKLWTR